MKEIQKAVAPVDWTSREIAAVRETDLFLLRIAVKQKFWVTFEDLRDRLKERVAGRTFLAPEGIDVEKGQIAKGENHEGLPFVYLDFPKSFSQTDKCTFRSFFWWGKHLIFALLLEGKFLPDYKKRLIQKDSVLWKGGYHLSIAETLWQWEKGAGSTVELLPDAYAEIARRVKNAPFLKIAYFLDLSPALFEGDRIISEGLKRFEDLSNLIRP